MALCLIPQILCYIDVMCYVIICTKEQNKKLKRKEKIGRIETLFSEKLASNFQK